MTTYSDEFAPAPEIDAMFARMAQALVAIGFLPEDNPDHIMFSLRALFGRSGLKPRGTTTHGSSCGKSTS